MFMITEVTELPTVMETKPVGLKLSAWKDQCRNIAIIPIERQLLGMLTSGRRMSSK